MISIDMPIWQQIILAVSSVLAVVLMFQMGAARARENLKSHEKESRELSDPDTRRRLDLLLKRTGVTGDADIRDGKVYAPVDPSKLDPLALRLANAFALRQRLRNPAACSLYLMDSEGGGTRLVDLDLEDIGDAARVMYRVAEDRKKSRSLYRGMTDEEVTSLVRAGMSRWLKDHGKYDASNHAMQGLLDEGETAQIAVEVLRLAFQIKKAEA